MFFQGRLFYPNTLRPKNSLGPFALNSTLHSVLFTLLLSSLSILNSGCVSDQVNQTDALIEYQQTIAQKGPQKRIGTTGNDLADPLGLLKPVPSTEIIYLN